jgi:hypothetical protein
MKNKIQKFYKILPKYQNLAITRKNNKFKLKGGENTFQATCFVNVFHISGIRFFG